jgi:hypothetical protein
MAVMVGDIDEALSVMAVLQNCAGTARRHQARVKRCCRHGGIPHAAYLQAALLTIRQSCSRSTGAQQALVRNPPRRVSASTANVWSTVTAREAIWFLLMSALLVLVAVRDA